MAGGERALETQRRPRTGNPPARAISKRKRRAAWRRSCALHLDMLRRPADSDPRNAMRQLCLPNVNLDRAERC